MVVYLGLGSNLGDRAAHLVAAVRALAELGRGVASSAIYETRPEGGAAQPDYLNAVIRMETDLAPGHLLDACMAIERHAGRVRPPGIAKASRTLDIDVLLYGDWMIDEPNLRVPHPRLLVRPFVRIPLAEVALPGLCHPQTGDSLTTAPRDASVRLFGPMPGV